MKKILVPCDFSSPSRAAFKTAMDWAYQTGGEVIVLHVIFIQVAYAGYGSEAIPFNFTYLEDAEKRAKSEFEKMKEEANLPSVKSRLELTYGDVMLSIRNFMEPDKIDFIIMGTSGSSGMSEVFIGSNTEKVVRHSPVPVLAIREYVSLGSIKHILFPTLMGLNQTEFIKKLKELQEFLHATLHILLVNSPSNFITDCEAKETFDDFLNQYKLENCQFHFSSYRSEEEGIIDFAITQKMDLIAMATHARKGLAHLFNGSITEDLVNHVTSPIWTYIMQK